MIEPVCRALVDTNTFGQVAVARLEWIKFRAESQEAVAREYARHASPAHTRLHQDHVPVIDEDGLTVDYRTDLARALELGYDSVMIDGSRLTLEENIRATRVICELAHERSVPVEGELGAVMGHEEGPELDYEELFASGKGFTDPGEAARFVQETGVDWLSVAVGSVHGAISAAAKDKEKIRARLNIDHLATIHDATEIPLVLHGGSGIGIEDLRAAFRNGIAKINIATDIRQPYERAVAAAGEAGAEPGTAVAAAGEAAAGPGSASTAAGREAVYRAVREIVDRLGIAGSAAAL
jgi:ketose-bisphosphate aldolase